MAPTLSLVDTVPARDEFDFELTPARQELRRLGLALTEARAELDAASKPISRLQAAIDELASTEAELARERTADDVALADWLVAGAEAPRPQPSKATLAAEQRLAQASRDGAAARAALPDAQARAQEAAARARELADARQDALLRAAGEAAASYCRGVWLPTLLASVKQMVPVAALRDELLTIGNATDSRTALAVAATISDLMKETRSQAVCPHDAGAGRRFLIRLGDEPTAEIGDE